MDWPFKLSYCPHMTCDISPSQTSNLQFRIILPTLALSCKHIDRSVRRVYKVNICCFALSQNDVIYVIFVSDSILISTHAWFQFLGVWYEIARFPTWYEHFGACAYKTIQYCGRRIEIEHVFVRDGIQFVLHVNSTYYPGDEAVFTIQENNIG